jgi:hypothetical protein
LSKLPQGKEQRASVITKGGVTLQGYLDPKRVSLYTQRAVAVAVGAVWVGTGHEVKFIMAGVRGVQVERRLVGSFDQVVSAWAPCAALSLDRTVPKPWDVPGSAQGFVSKGSVVELFSEPTRGASAVFSARAAQYADGILFWSTSRRAGFVRIEYHGDVVIDAWARHQDLKMLPPGERSDRLVAPRKRRSPPMLKLQGKPKVTRLAKPTKLRLTAKDSAEPVGVVEAGTEVYVLDTIAGWASVLPKALDLTAPGGGQFWISAEALP